VRGSVLSVSLNKDYVGGTIAMPVSESLPTALLVKEIRKRLELTQVQFAQELGVSFQSVNRWERNKTKPLPIVLKLLEVMVKEIGENGSDLLAKYFVD
jgi:DNA-binding transcriptional regulator YiaG